MWLVFGEWRIRHGLDRGGEERFGADVRLWMVLLLVVSEFRNSQSSHLAAAEFVNLAFVLLLYCDFTQTSPILLSTVPQSSLPVISSNPCVENTFTQETELS
jgi:hypothetical protein